MLAGCAIGSIAGRATITRYRSALDQAMNNTSLILLFKIGKKRLLFPGDAQIETWRYALKEAKNAAANRRELASTDFYKVGHHGSLNATPHSLWDLFDKKKGKKLKSALSTMPGVHGHSKRRTEVPRRTLVTALDKGSRLKRTDEMKAKDLYFEIEVPI
jgi:hypothetical protein